MPSRLSTSTPILTCKPRRLTRWERYHRMLYLIKLGEEILAEIRDPVTLDLGDDMSELVCCTLQHAEANYRTSLAHKRVLVAKRLRCYLHDPLPSHRKKAHKALCVIMCMNVLPYAVTWRTTISSTKCP